MYDKLIVNMEFSFNEAERYFDVLRRRYGAMHERGLMLLAINEVVKAQELNEKIRKGKEYASRRDRQRMGNTTAMSNPIKKF